jgi:hypothetical protein
MDKLIKEVNPECRWKIQWRDRDSEEKNLDFLEMKLNKSNKSPSRVESIISRLDQD